MESIKIQYTDPSDGLDKYDIVRFDIAKFRKDASLVPSEDFFFTSSVSSISTLREIPDLTEASLVSNPLDPYGCTNVVYGLVKTKPSGGATVLELTQNPTKLGFVTGQPCALLTNFTSTATLLGYVVPNNVTSTSLEFAAAVPSNIFVNTVVVALPVPKAAAPEFKRSDEAWGAKSLLERPNAPTVDATPGSGSITVNLVAPTTKARTIKKYDVYIISETISPEFDILNPIILGNRKPDLSITPATTMQGIATTYGGGTNAGTMGGTIGNGKYYIVAVAKDADTDMAVNCSALSNIDEVTVSY